MTLEQRIEALEQAVKVLVCGEFTVENGQVFIQKTFNQDGLVTAANTNAAEYTLLAGIDYDAERERKLDLITTLMNDSQALSRL